MLPTSVDATHNHMPSLLWPLTQAGDLAGNKTNRRCRSLRWAAFCVVRLSDCSDAVADVTSTCMPVCDRARLHLADKWNRELQFQC